MHTLWYNWTSSHFSWSREKDELLRHDRGVSFEDVIYHIRGGGLLDVLDHPNQERYPGQRIFVVNLGDYAYLVPFVSDQSEIFLKTIIPSRKATRDYLERS